MREIVYKDYDRVFGEFHDATTPREWFENLKVEIEESLKWPTVERRRKWNNRIYEKWVLIYNEFLEYVRLNGDIEGGVDEAVTWYHTTCLQDIELFALNYTLPQNGLPPFLAEWQVELANALITKYRVAGLTSRKIGKSFSGAVVTLYLLVNGSIRGGVSRGHHVRMFAPKKRQLVIREEVNNILRRSRFWAEEWILKDNKKDKYHSGIFSEEKLVFGRNNSSMKGDSLAQTSSKGRAATGEMGDSFIVDEFGQIVQESFNMAILPMMADAYSIKRLCLLGTPTLDINPDLKNYWRMLKEDPLFKCFSHDWVYGVETGCILSSYMEMVFNGMIKGEEATYVPCPFGQKYGKCAKMAEFKEGVRIDEQTFEFKYPGDEGYDDSWECDECCLMNKTFVEEYGADFAKADFRYWPVERMKSLGDASMNFYDAPIWVPKDGTAELYVGIDFGSQAYPTEIVVGEKVGNELYIRAYHQIPPLTVDEKKIPKENLDPTLEKCKEFLAPFQKYIKKIYLDITGDKWKTFTERVKLFFPRNKIWLNEISIKNGYLGVYVDGPFNAEMKRYLKLMINMGWLHIPRREPFFSRFIWQMEHCVVKETSQGYMSFKEPTKGLKRIDLLDAMGFLCISMNSKLNKGEGVCNTISVGTLGGNTHNYLQD